MIKRAYLVLTLLMCLLLPMVSYSATAESIRNVRHKQTLTEYIDDNCKKGCVDPKSLLKSVMQSARKLDTDFRILLAIIKVESGFKVKARNAGNVGLSQILLRYHKPKFKGKDYTNVSDNVNVGAIVFTECKKKHNGNLNKALKCYNGGADPQYPKKVNKALSEIKQLTLNDEDDDPMGEFIETLQLFQA